MKTELHTIELIVNGERYRIDVSPRWTLVDVIRDQLHLTGTHIGCEHGVCGACTVLIDGEAIRSCLMLAVQADGSEIETVEGLAQDGQPHPLQIAFSEKRALQCGFCTSGFLMLAEGFLRSTKRASVADVRELVSSNLCRCTGYSGIVAAIAEMVDRDSYEV
jgi:carbon-monoxide dehydrogenase small subunit